MSMTTGKANVIIGDETARSITTEQIMLLLEEPSDTGATDAAGYSLTQVLII